LQENDVAHCVGEPNQFVVSGARLSKGEDDLVWSKPEVWLYVLEAVS
jgi:hypothetical protein